MFRFMPILVRVHVVKCQKCFCLYSPRNCFVFASLVHPNALLLALLNFFSFLSNFSSFRWFHPSPPNFSSSHFPYFHPAVVVHFGSRLAHSRIYPLPDHLAIDSKWINARWKDVSLPAPFWLPVVPPILPILFCLISPHFLAESVFLSHFAFGHLVGLVGDLAPGVVLLQLATMWLEAKLSFPMVQSKCRRMRWMRRNCRRNDRFPCLLLSYLASVFWVFFSTVFSNFPSIDWPQKNDGLMAKGEKHCKISGF